jgi:hypothetical protein
MRYLKFLVLFLCLTQYVYSYEVKGRVMLGDKPVSGAKVKVYQENYRDVIKETQTDKEGYFCIELDEGIYNFVSEYEENNKLYKGFSGKNPFFVNENYYVGIKLLPLYRYKVQKNKKKSTIIEGTVLFNGKHLEGATAFLYLSMKDIKGMPYLYSQPTDKKGRFLLKNIIPGEYVVIVRKKINGSLFGPLEEGDYMGFFQYNPFNFESNKTYKIVIPMFKKIQDEMPLQLKGQYKIRGIAVDEHGQPVAGVYAFAYKNKELGHERPVSISKKTSNDGLFELYLPSSGKYYIGVREFYGGTPVQGERYGLYDGSFDHHIIVDKDIENIKIVVKKILQ